RDQRAAAPVAGVHDGDGLAANLLRKFFEGNPCDLLNCCVSHRNHPIRNGSIGPADAPPLTRSAPMLETRPAPPEIQKTRGTHTSYALRACEHRFPHSHVHCT